MKRTLGTMLAAAVLTACGTTPSLPTTDSPRDAVPGDTVDQTPAAARAFTLLGDAPSPRQKHAALYDAAGDRMLVFGGDANDLWAQRLDAPNAGRWERIEASGEAPPPGEVVMTLDEKAHRLIVFAGTSLDRAWTLSLDGPGTWQVLGFGNAPKIALGFSLTTDPTGRRLFAYTSGQPEMWEIPLDGGTTWTRIAGSPQNGGFSCRDTLVYDGDNAQLLVLSGGWPRGNVFALSLQGTPSWTKRNKDMAWFDYGAVMLFDQAARRFLVMDPNETGWLWSFSADDAAAKWSHLPIEPSEHGRRWGGSAIYDAGRGRAVLFGGADSSMQMLRDDTWALSLGEAPSWEQVGTLDRRVPTGLGQSLAEDGATGTILRFGGLASGTSSSSLRFDGATGSWEAIGDTPMVTGGWSAGAWDRAGHRLLTFGGYSSPQQDQTSAFDLASSTWTAIGGEGAHPSARSHHTMLGDAGGRRMLVFGGLHMNESGALDPVDDLWAFSVVDDTWSELDAAGPGPSARQAHAAALDSAGRRMLVHGGADSQKQLDDTWMLELAPSPHWVSLSPKGDAPPAMSGHFAVFDPDTRRFLIIGNAPDASKSWATQVAVWSLSTEGEARWQRYCPTGTRPAMVDGALWTERGLFLTAGGSSWIFDSSSPFCER